MAKTRRTTEKEIQLEVVQKSGDYCTALLWEEEVQVKGEPEEVNPLALSIEEQFDTSGNGICISPSVELVSKSKSSTCGSIKYDVAENTRSYKLICNYCDFTIDIDDWKLFVEHMDNDHKQLDNTEEIGFLPETDAMEESSPENVDNERQDCNFDNNTSLDDSDNESEHSVDKKKSSVLISFGNTPKHIVINLLEMMKSNAVLWHSARTIKNRFNEALIEITKQFNAEYPQNQLTDEQMRISIARIKYIYHRATNTKHKRHIRAHSLLEKFSDYFKLCAEIEAKSKAIETKCKICGVSFLSEIKLQIHNFQVHSIGELPYKCQRCGRGFSKPGNLHYHEKKHGDKTYKCEYCPKTFDQEEKLHFHIRMHTGCKQVCEICGKQFPNAYRYKRHKLHHEPPKEKCKICGKMLYEKYTLSEHMKSHRNEREYVCNICNKTFNHQNGLSIHKRSVHKIATQYIWASRK